MQPAELVVLVTRPQPQADDWARRLREQGVDARSLPLMAIAEAADLAPLHEAWAALAGYRLVMFVSPNALGAFWAQRPAAANWPAGTLAGATGPGTAVALRAAGVPPAQIVQPDDGSEQFDAETLWTQRLARLDWRGARVLVVRGDGGRDWLADKLRERGASVEFVQAYSRTAPEQSASERALLQAAAAHPQAYCWLFSSSQAVAHLRALAPASDWSRGHAIATHPRIAASARDCGFAGVSSAAPTLAAIVAAIRRILQSQRS